MALDGSPKKFAMDVASGLYHINRITLKRYSEQEVRKIASGLEMVAKKLRATAVESGDYMALKDKGLKSQRVQGALQTIRAYLREIEKQAKKPRLT
ncbi:MAG: hypothetical protein KDD52_04375 [Bdellovibrionales bacterium]|nr:hypothetical protein [Bdellovibrionales bacterium]